MSAMLGSRCIICICKIRIMECSGNSVESGLNKCKHPGKISITEYVYNRGDLFYYYREAVG